MLGLFGPLFGFPDWLVQPLAARGDAEGDGDGVDVRGLWWLLLAVGGRRRGIPRAHAPARTGDGRIA